MDYRKHFSTIQTSQKEKIPGTDQVQNNAGGYAWAVDDWVRLERFLVLGSEGGTYYVNEKELTVRNAEAVMRCIKQDGPRTVGTAEEISVGGRAPKNDPALFVLALACSHGDPKTKDAAYQALLNVARTGTHLFHFLHYVEGFRGWGRGLRRAVAGWYNAKPVEKLIYQVIKYRQRDGWSHRDALRLSHPKPLTDDHNELYKWITHEKFKVEGEMCSMFSRIAAFEEAQRTDDPKVIAKLIEEHDLPREAIPTEYLSSPLIWEALFDTGMPMTAMIRNLGNMTRLGILKPLGKRTATVIERLSDQEQLGKARVHPIAILVALRIYAHGIGFRGKGEWEPMPEITDALDEAFYLAFGVVEPTNKRIILALDVSGSMTMGMIAGVPLSPREGAAAMALVTKAVEKQCTTMAFCDKFIPLAISERERLDDVIQKTSGLPFGGTDCALPMLWALEKGVEADTFVIYTDSETWFGDIHPMQALEQYRRKTGIPAKLIVVGMVSNGFSIADPNDAGMLDVVGFDTATPNVIAGFIKQ